MQIFGYIYVVELFKFSDKMDLTFQIRIINNVRDRHANCLKLGDDFLLL